MTNKRRVFVAGHNGMVGSAIVRQLESQDDIELVLRDRKALDLLSQAAVADFFACEQIDEVYLAAAKVGGIHANNNYPAEFIYQNLTIAANIIHYAYTYGVRRLLFLGSSCIYPRLASQPIKEYSLLKGQLEPSNEPYAIAKIAGIKLCESYNRQYETDYRAIMPSNVYGQHDNFHNENAHVLPALMRRMHDAKTSGSSQVTVWGDGTPMREFIHVDDLAIASVHIMNADKAAYHRETMPMQSHINVGSGTEYSIRELAKTIAKVVAYRGRLKFDASKPNGTPRKLTDIARIKALGWRPAISLQSGLRLTYEWFLSNQHTIRK